jgi:hypothetical protein
LQSTLTYVSNTEAQRHNKEYRTGAIVAEHKKIKYHAAQVSPHLKVTIAFFFFNSRVVISHPLDAIFCSVHAV